MILNPKTNRMMKLRAQMHRRAVKEGILPPDTLKIPDEPKPIETEITKEPDIPDGFTVEKGIAEISTNIIADNKKTFHKLNQQDTTELLRKLLYEKLYPKEKEKEKVKVKSKSKPKLTLKKYYPSSDSESD